MSNELDKDIMDDLRKHPVVWGMIAHVSEGGFRTLRLFIVTEEKYIRDITRPVWRLFNDMQFGWNYEKAGIVPRYVTNRESGDVVPQMGNVAADLTKRLSEMIGFQLTSLSL